jgi:hypothetical protein
MQLKSEFAKLTDVTTLSFDVRDQKGVERLVSLLCQPSGRMWMYSLTTQATLMVFDPIQSGKLEDWDAMMDINCEGLLIRVAGIHSRDDEAPIRAYHQSGVYLGKRSLSKLEMSIVPASLPSMP